MNHLRVTVLVNNYVTKRNLLAEHGLAMLIECGDHRILFDTGQGLALQHNAAALAIDPTTADAIVLSHGHYDHTGGLEDVLRISPQIPVYAHSRAVQRRYARNADGTVRSVATENLSDVLTADGVTHAATDTATEVTPGVWVTGSVPRVTSCEDTGGDFYLDTACTTPDDIIDDQAVYVPTAAGTVIILGCAHAGVINTVLHVQSLTNHAPVRAIIGGMHLNNADDNRMTATIEALRAAAPAVLVPMHCTGQRATMQLWQAMGHAWQDSPIGAVLSFDV